MATELAESPVGGMAALGIHQIDNFHYLAGSMGAVLAESTRLLPEGEVDDTTMISLRFESGALGHLFTSMATGPTVELTAFGTEAIARNTGDGARLTLQSRGSTEQTEVPLDPLDTVADQFGEFAAAIRGETQPETGGLESAERSPYSRPLSKARRPSGGWRSSTARRWSWPPSRRHRSHFGARLRFTSAAKKNARRETPSW